MRFCLLCFALVVLGLAATTCSEEEIGFPPSNEEIVRLFRSRFGVHVDVAPIVYNKFEDAFISTIYKQGQLLRIRIARGGKVSTRQITPRFPKGVQHVFCVIRLSDYLIDKLDSVKFRWEMAQQEINTLHLTYAQSIGGAVPIVSFENQNYYVSQLEFPFQPGASMSANTQDLAAQLGVNLNAFDIKLIMDLDTDAPAGGWGDYKSGYAKVGWIYDESFAISEHNFSGLAYAAYQHEIGHVWGWEHNWSDPYDETAFITRPELFGWTDLTGDGTVEILSQSPYEK